jgi:hypothetical protein
MMKSPPNKTAKEKLNFRWDHQAAQNDRKTIYANAGTFEAYFTLLEEIKPHPHELREIPTYTSPFRLD